MQMARARSVRPGGSRQPLNYQGQEGPLGIRLRAGSSTTPRIASLIAAPRRMTDLCGTEIETRSREPWGRRRYGVAAVKSNVFGLPSWRMKASAFLVAAWNPRKVATVSWSG